ncbi:pyridine nucleotide-disulfide oxidoreductase [Candidatus Jorgensenbacteria bacterium CG_4_10_14_0_8_um_filter_39_13]|uniref:Pyridine nucleotide-disulfide oxidoreductase n=2 Tax=Candidatus Joergenseniibacteriota TaxID=1752739 RepID=A0A2M7RJF5_9BACT|nr:MAG: pyridine nucleotide-disulfide oxidoreductase [Candidatus Jorgensenbacteria bacterium CG11_big_fil_rev_8_21_14_0_20_38_23]PIV13280.1 MAG: pyridine nucleotide-disulfide oxidoreductase [Candidatus Jorgensenbacteria bacterium CG03_land_8_20_14_0_80_38_39]PIY96591.1 MAG: pyridine nucleotide-disulfide oxidoreductase [Candidatus Jorgensenbacteria bacterium CG_4_10_14_0_8_um_filter_39_13]PJA95002.1 MAG: pyridine nucleotide-disulfide oxidoreductase [Candidatus Jorgensenbacteria bacterium CG_4_9_1
MIYDVIIVGLGPAGVAAGIYASRKKLNTLIVGEEFGGQSVVSADIQNWIGTSSLSGVEMAERLEKHLKAGENIKIVSGEKIEVIEKVKVDAGFFFRLKSNKNNIFEAKTLLIASGSRRRPLNVPGEKEFSGKGVFYCSICDAPLMKDKKVAVIGGGNAGLEAVGDLLPYASFIYLLEFTKILRADPLTQERFLKNEKVKVIFNVQVKEVFGEQFVQGLTYEDLNTGEEKKLELSGIFVEIGSLPNSEFVKNLVQIDKTEVIIVEPLSGKTSQEGIWAAGDVTNLPYKQNNIAMGDAIRAILNIYDYLNQKNS